MVDERDRRRFLKQTAVAAGATLAPGWPAPRCRPTDP